MEIAEVDAPNDTTPPDMNLMEMLMKFVKEFKGTILIAEIVLCIIITICFAVSIYGGYISFVIWEMVSTLIIFLIFALELHRRIMFISFIWTDFIRALTSSLIFIISLIIVASSKNTREIVGGVFGIFAALLYGYDAYLVLVEINESRSPPVIMVTGI